MNVTLPILTGVSTVSEFGTSIAPCGVVSTQSSDSPTVQDFGVAAEATGIESRKLAPSSFADTTEDSAITVPSARCAHTVAVP